MICSIQCEYFACVHAASIFSGPKHTDLWKTLYAPVQWPGGHRFNSQPGHAHQAAAHQELESTWAVRSPNEFRAAAHRPFRRWAKHRERTETKLKGWCRCLVGTGYTLHCGTHSWQAKWEASLLGPPQRWTASSAFPRQQHTNSDSNIVQWKNVRKRLKSEHSQAKTDRAVFYHLLAQRK